MRGEAGALARVAEQLRHALENIGFLIVVNHGIAPELTDGIVEQARRFHAHADGRKAETRDGARPGQRVYRLPAVGRVFGQDLGGQRQRPARPQRSVFHGPRARPGRSRSAGRQAVSRAEQMARQPSRLSRFPARVLGGDGAVFAKTAAGIRDGARSAAGLFRPGVCRCAMRAAPVAFPADPVSRQSVRAGAAHRREFLHRAAAGQCRGAVHPARRVGSGSRRRASPARSSSMPATCAGAGRTTGFYRRSISRST